jgi:16S rRNA U1498 N3-methylase RsmE
MHCELERPHDDVTIYDCSEEGISGLLVINSDFSQIHAGKVRCMARWLEVVRVAMCSQAAAQT